MAKYPIFLELGGRRAVVIGGGSVALRKVQSLIEAEARLVVVAERVSELMTALCAETSVELVKARYSKDYLVGAVIAIGATNDRRLNRRIYSDCQELEILCNIVDEPGLCDFFVPSVVQRGNLQVAIGTGGKSPAYAAHIRKKLEGILTAEHGRFLDELDGLRERIKSEVSDIAERKVLSGELVSDGSFEFYVANGPAAWRNRAEGIIRERKGEA